MEIKKINLILENCEVISVPRKFIAGLMIEDIQEHVSRLAVNSISKYKMCKEFYIELSRELAYYRDNDTFRFDDDSNISRLNWSDITGIELIYENDTKEIIHPIFEGQSLNEYQSYYLIPKEDELSEHDICIYIGKDKKIEDFMTIQDMNDIDFLYWD